MQSPRVYFNNIGSICTDSLGHGNGLSALLLLTRAAKSSAAKSSASKTRSMESRLYRSVRQMPSIITRARYAVGRHSTAGKRRFCRVTTRQDDCLFVNAATPASSINTANVVFTDRLRKSVPRDVLTLIWWVMVV